MSCVMSRPSAPPTERMNDARDFLYWLNHVSCACTQTHTTFIVIVKEHTNKFQLLLLLGENTIC